MKTTDPARAGHSRSSYAAMRQTIRGLKMRPLGFFDHL